MTSYLPRRTVLTSLIAIPAMAALVSGCSDSGSEAMAQSASTDAQTTASVEPPAPVDTVDMEKLLEPGALPPKVLGEADAPVTIVEYASMTCSHCASFHNNTLPAIKEKYIDTGKARLIMREFPFDPRAEAGFMLARCAEDNYFAMVDVLFEQQDNWARVEDARSALLRLSKLAGFTQESFEACLTNQDLLENVRAVRHRAASEFDVRATPTFFINGNKYEGAFSVDEMSAIIESML